MMAEEKKVTKRKRKLHHGPSSLLRATIQEDGIYDREVDAYKTRFIKLFDFLESWKNSVTRNDSFVVSPPGPYKNGTTISTEETGNKSRNGNIVIEDFYSSKALGRDFSLEEELEIRLGRMTSIAKSLKCLYAKEREQKVTLYQEVTETKQSSLQLLNDMISHFHRETGILQHRLLEMDGTIDEMDHERQSLSRAYEDMVNHATKTVDVLETELDRSENRVRELTMELGQLGESFSLVEDKNRSLWDETEGLKLTIQTLNEKVALLESNALTSEKSRDHFEVLLDIALAKLRMTEDGELPVEPKKRAANTTVSSTSSSSTSVHPSGPPGASTASEYTSNQKVVGPLTTPTKPRLSLDSQSITSFETVSEASMSTFDSPRGISDDRLSNASIQSRSTFGSPSGTASPKELSRRKHSKKKPFFSISFLKKNQPLEGQSPVGSPADRLPPITDELSEFRASQSSLAESHVIREAKPIGRVSFDDGICPRGSASHPAPLERGRCHSIDSLHSSCSLSYPEAQPVEDIKKMKKVQRTTSFAGLRKNGLVALAKEVEKRFKKKRRAKTADGAEILQARTEYERARLDFRHHPKE